MSEYTNGGLPQPTPTPIPQASRSINGDVASELPQLPERSSPNKSVRWNGQERDIIEIQKASIAIGKVSYS